MIATGGRIHGGREVGGAVPTAIAWAADVVLAVGPDDVVRAISRGDSTFLALDGCVVTPLDPGAVLEPGAPADLAFWGPGSEPGAGSRQVALVRAGAFTDGDIHHGPFRDADA